MNAYAPRVMPIVVIVQQRDLTYLVRLPGGDKHVIDAEHARRLVWREAPGSSIRWVQG